MQQVINETVLHNTGESYSRGRIVRHNKVYTVRVASFRSPHASVNAQATIYTVAAQWGRIGGSQKSQIKYQGSSKYAAEAAAADLILSKRGRGYRVVAQS